MPGKAAKYLFPFSYQLLDYPMDVGKGGAKSANHLFKTFAPLLLARKGVEFHEINGHKIVRPVKVTLINDFLNKAGDNCFVLRGLHGIPFSDFCNSVNRLVARGCR
jgi:hypothetical protein